ncbi:MAG: hypothetical protein ACLFN8_03940 [Candidatus Woesearchaeota archaeon]
MVNFISRLKSNLVGATLGNYARAKSSAGRFVRGSFGGFKGAYSFARMQVSIETFAAREILDERVERAQLMAISKYAHRLSSFNSKTFSKTFNAYSSNPRKLKVVISDIVQVFLNDSIKFHDAFSSFLEAVEDSVSRLEELEDSLLDNTLSFLVTASDFASAGKFTLPPESVSQIKKEVDKLINDQISKYKKYISDQNKEISDIKNKKNTGKRIKTLLGVGWVSFKMKKLIDKISKDSLDIILKDASALNRQINSGMLDATFLPTLKEYLSGLSFCESFAKDLRKDIKLFFDTAERDYFLVRVAFANFITILGNEEGVDVLKEQIANLDLLTLKIKDLLVEESKDLSILKDHLIQFRKEAPALLDAIKSESEKRLNIVKNAGSDQVLNDFMSR